MYTILVTHNNELIATEKHAIMQYSKLIDDLRFLVPIDYGKHDMSTFNVVVLEYVSPISHKYRVELLELQDERYKEHLQYILPVDTGMTDEAGDVEIHLSFLKVEMDVEGHPFERVRKTDSLKIHIRPIENWSQFIADEALTPLDQRIVQMQAIQEEITARQKQLAEQINNFIDDENISDKTTYSSKKIEEFIDREELGEAVADVEAGNHQTISDDMINKLID